MGKSYFDGGLFQLIGWRILGALVTICTLGICLPWAVCMIYDWETKHTVINGHRLRFNGTALQLFGTWIKWWFFTLITLGIYGFWIPIKLKRWIIKHSEFADMTVAAGIPQTQQTTTVTYSAQHAVAVQTSGGSSAYIVLLVIGILFSVIGLVSILIYSWWGYAAVAAGIGLLAAAGNVA